MCRIDFDSYRSTKGFNRRVRFLIIHNTTVDFETSVNLLTGPSVSAHYLVPDPTDASYRAIGFEDMRIFNLVLEDERAWHAGISNWAGRNNLNDTSIGIEIVNITTKEGNNFNFTPYNPLQIEALKSLVTNIKRRFPDITPTHVLGHSDVSIGRKSDPGATFPWEDLYKAGIGAWYDKEVMQGYLSQFNQSLPTKADVIAKLKTYGYCTNGAETINGYRNLIRAFQLHFRQKNYDGILDIETAAILYALVEKYF